MFRLKQLVISLFVVTTAVEASAGALRDKAFALLQRLNSAVVERQVADISDPDRGAIRCRGCGVLHTRAGEAVFPLAYEYSLTGDKDRMLQAKMVAEWLLHQQQDNGSWMETPETWTGTTTDQLLMLLLSYPLLERQLNARERKAWLGSMERAADYLTDFINNRNSSINYCSTTAATLAEAYRRFGKESYARKARELAHMVVAKMNYEGFIEGEGGRVGMYRYGVDIGYNMEMSLWGLCRYALIMSDEDIMRAVEQGASVHLPFIYPDGMLDGSAGTRSNKWTIYGSGTSDGPHPLFAMLSASHPEYISAAVRNIGRISDCFSSCGLLGMGPDYDNICREEPCIYPTFTKAKSMAMAMLWLARDSDASAPLPTDVDTLVFRRSIGTAVVRKGPFCATVTAYGYKSSDGVNSKNMFRPTGGAMSALWIEGMGLVQASSQTEYHRWEPMSFPEMGEITPLTPRIEIVREGCLYTNLFEFDARVSARQTDGKTVCSVSGSLKDREQKSSGVSYSLDYIFEEEALTKIYTLWQHSCTEPVQIVEPVVYDEGLGVAIAKDGSWGELSREGRRLRISVSGGTLTADWKGLENCHQIYPSLRALPLVIAPDMDGSKQIRISYRVLE